MIGSLFTMVFDEIQRIWCYRLLAAATAAAIFCAGAAYVLHMPSQYEAWGQLYVSKQTPLAVATEGVSLVGQNYGSPYVVQKTLMNDNNLESVLRKMNLGAASLSRPAMAAAIARLRNKIRIAPDEGDGFIEFHYSDSDPVRAHNVVRLLLNQFISTNVDRSRRDLNQASEFLDQQIAAHAAMLADSRAKMAAYRQSHPDAVGLRRLANDGDTVTVETAGSDPPVTAPTPAAPPPVSARLSAANERVAQLEARLTQLRTAYTDQYPDVVATRRQLADAVAEQGLEASDAAAAAAATPAASPTRSRPARVRTIRRSAASAPDTPPAVSAEYADLQKSDATLQLVYEQLIAKRAATRMSEAVYGSDGSGKYQITREPTVPTFPTGPNRILFLAMAAVLATGGGLAAAYLRGAINGIFVSPRELEKTFQLPVVGVVSWESAWRTRGLRRLGPREKRPAFALRTRERIFS
jgi:polysaccharide chain length determinant protein (PEP-CTERM system associated)